MAEIGGGTTQSASLFAVRGIREKGRQGRRFLGVFAGIARGIRADKVDRLRR